MTNKHVMLEEGVYIMARPSILAMDKITILQERVEAKEIWQIVFWLEAIRILLSNNTSEQIIDDMMASDLDDESMERMTKWFEKLTETLDYNKELKKKQGEWSKNIEKT